VLPSPGPLGELAALSRYPVKSLGGERLDRVELDLRGVVGDRLWSVRDLDGKLGSGKSTRRFRRMPGLLELSASYDGEVPVIGFPDGRSCRGDDESVHTALSEHVGRPVALAREGAVSHFDEGPVHLVTTASLSAAAGGLPVDPRRTRANVVVDTALLELLASGEPVGAAEGILGSVDGGWSGRRLRLGPDVELLVSAAMPRCVMLGMAQDGLPADPGLLQAVTARHQGELGVVASVVVPGEVGLGDEVRLL